MPAAPSSPARVLVDESDPDLGVLADVPVAPAGLLASLQQVPDPRCKRGVRHAWSTIVVLTVAAVLTGARSVAAVGEWATDLPAQLRAELGIVGDVPSTATFRRALQAADPDEFSARIGAWMWLRTTSTDGRRVIAFDGKTMRGARDTTGSLPHLLAGLCQRTGTVLTQVAVGPKTNEIPALRALLASVDLANTVVTADAMHCQRDTAQTIHAGGGDYILTVKANQPTLLRRLRGLPWKQIPDLHVMRLSGHGRTGKQTIKATAIDDRTVSRDLDDGIGFPHARQVLRIVRTRTLPKTATRKAVKKTTETIYVVTSLAATDATPEQIADWLRGHWHIENKLHWVRDVTFDEDRHQLRVGHAPQNMASVRNLVISLLRLSGHDNIASALRHHSRDPQRPVKLLLTS